MPESLVFYDGWCVSGGDGREEVKKEKEQGGWMLRCTQQYEQKCGCWGVVGFVSQLTGSK